MNNVWKFSKIPQIEEASFHNVLEKFYNFGISGLVRENIQNSLDAKIAGNNDPVTVKIVTGKINKKFIPGLEEIKNRINSLKASNSYTKETIDHMKKKMNDEEMSYISFEDTNTKGLSGAHNGQSENQRDTWGAYAYNKGVHPVEENEEKEKSRGGSHGIGKIASNAASELYMMYFANCDEKGNKHLGGTVQLIEHKYEGYNYRSTGYFADEKDSKFYPFENDFDDIFQKNSRGLKIIIPFLRKQFNDEKETLRSVCDSFFVAILEKNLVVSINDEIINSKTISDYIKSDKYYIQVIDEIKKDFTPLYFDTYLSKEVKELVIKDINKEHNFKLYFNYDENIKKGRVGIIRTIGMKIEDKKVKGNVNKPFNAVLVPDSVLEDEFLKSLENESHTELSFVHIKDQQSQKNAKRFINNISKEVEKIIEEHIRKNNPTDGVIDTSDLLYDVVNEFKQDLSQSIASVRVDNSNKSKTIIKVNDIKKPPKKKISNPNSKTNSKPKSKPKPPKSRKVKKEIGDTGAKEYYSANPSSVERVIINNKEFLKFDLSNNSEIIKSKACDVFFAVVDGMGAEYLDEFKLKDNYDHIIDMQTKKELKVKNNSIKNVSMKDGIFKIELKLNSNFNKTLKFVYFLEV